jgi:hypothetical protein
MVWLVWAKFWYMCVRTGHAAPALPFHGYMVGPCPVGGHPHKMCDRSAADSSSTAQKRARPHVGWCWCGV